MNSRFRPLPIVAAPLAALACAFVVGASTAQPVTQPFTFSLLPHAIPAVRHGGAAWGDYDGDGDLDVFVSGITESGALTALYRNDGKQPSPTADGVGGETVFTPVQKDFTTVVYSGAAWGDFDNDGDLDLVVQGSLSIEDPYEPVTTLYRNDEGEFVAVDAVHFVGLHSGVLAWADFDNDGDQDLLIAGEDADARRHTLLYQNQGDGQFTDAGAEIMGVGYGDAAWADFDNDGDLDLAVAGVTDDGFRAALYANDGGVLVEHETHLESSGFASLDWGDFDGDGDPDLLLSGGRVTPFVLEGHTRLYRNDNGSFTSVDVDFPGSFSGSASWGDYDNDGDLDVFVLGSEAVFGDRTARLYTNEGGTFRLTAYLIGALFAAADWGDYDGDGDLDLLTTGLSSFGPPITNLYENRRQVKPVAATAPAAMRTSVDGRSVRFGWDHVSEAPAASYNLRVGTVPGAGDVLTSLSEPSTGRRLVSRPGNAGASGEWFLRDLQAGTYYWSVQTVNGAMHASSFSSEESFRIEQGEATAAETEELPETFLVHPNFPNPFSGRTSLKIDLPEAARLTVTVFDALGNTVARLVDDVRSAGTHTISWSGRDAGARVSPSGVYFYHVRAGSRSQTGRMVFIP